MAIAGTMHPVWLRVSVGPCGPATCEDPHNYLRISDRTCALLYFCTEFTADMNIKFGDWDCCKQMCVKCTVPDGD
jgi:hypothetical protein